MRKVSYLCFLLVALLLDAQSKNSAFASGTWFKVGIVETGIHKIDRNTLDALGVPASIDPRKLKLFGNGWGGRLPQSNSETRPEDIAENAIFVSGEEDGSFDDQDYILFYAVGPDLDQWTAEGFFYEKNVYSDTSYYFLQYDESDGKRILTEGYSNSEEKISIASDVVFEYDDRIIVENDVNNLISSGRGWYGRIIGDGNKENLSFSIEGLMSDVTLQLSVVGQSPEVSEFEILFNGNLIGSLPIESIPDGPNTTYSIKARGASGSFNLESQADIDLQLSYVGNDPGSRGYIDHLYLTFKRELRLYGNETSFRSAKIYTRGVGYVIEGASENSMIWSIADPTEISSLRFAFQDGKAIVGGNDNNRVEEFVIFTGTDFPTPFVYGEVENQNLRQGGNYDGVIVTHPRFKQAAENLAQFHRDHDGLSVNVVTTNQVYNEFSSGRQDISAIRDYAKFLYDEFGSLKYLLLMGDCSYDYKDRIINNTNFVPTYESRQSFHPIFSYSSDDYYGFLDDDEGIWEESVAGDHQMEIGVGRLPAKTPEEAQAMVDKIVYYSTSPNTLGKWRSEITYVADDGDFNVHARHVEDLSELIDTSYAEYKINKVLLDAFQQEGTGSSEVSPQANAALKTRIKNGTFVVNFIGHGNEDLWMEEEILTLDDIGQLTNRNRLPIFVTATCEFGRYDNPLRLSGAEKLLLLEQGGGIALLTTSRPVFASTNFSLNQAFHENIFREEQGRNLRLGDVIRLTKNEGLEGPVNRNFTLLGDPMMMPAYPELEIVIDQNNDLDTLSALESITFTGKIERAGLIEESFNGRLLVNIFDIEESFKTFGQESDAYSYDLRTNAVFRGEVEVIEGLFTVSFVVPKNISYQFDNGKMSLYAWDKDTNVDAGGSSRTFVIGGSATGVEEDTDAPIITAFMNDETFSDGSVVGDSPLFVARLEDESGITTTNTGVIQGITLEMGDQLINLNDFYTADLNSFQSGTVVYPLQDLPPGAYSATVKVWDTHNNVSEKTVSFRVTDDPVLFVFNPLTYPNPIARETTFTFEHDREDEDLEVTVLIYGPRGDITFNTTYLFENSDRRIEIPWKAETNLGVNLPMGIYHSRLIIKSKLDGAVKEITNKLVIRN
ncbi:MAG: type IX secretion system sortase PorU [Ekhidna sp.]|nr:type IX secretion system sortase PorU [Ekhidna sp.]